MSDSAGLAKLKKWMHRNRMRPIPKPGKPGNRVTTHIYNIINNNNINIIDSADSGLEPVTSAPLQGVTGVTESGALKESGYPSYQRKKLEGNQDYAIISKCLPGLPRLPLPEGERGIEEEKVLVFQFLDWCDSEIAKWPEGTRAALAQIQDWFQAKGYSDPADRILAFITMHELMRRKGGPVILDPALAELERLAKDVFGPETSLYWMHKG